MPRIRYVGPFAAVHLPNSGIEVAEGQVVDVDTETHASLSEQTDWESTRDPVSEFDDDGQPIIVRAGKPAKKAAKKPEAVGESGPELVHLSEGEHITPAQSAADEGDNQ